MVLFSIRKTLLVALFACPLMAQADFGEIDSVVRESIGRFFDRGNRQVDLKMIEYIGEPTIYGNQMKVNSAVFGVERYERSWVWHDCVTKLRRNANDVWVDEGSDCYYEWD